LLQDLDLIPEKFFITLNDDILIRLIGNIREVFENHFDRTWFSVIIDGLPIDFRTFREIRELVTMETIHPGDERAIYEGVQELKSFITHIRKFLLPVLKERLRVSGLFPHQMVKDKTQYILRRFVVYTFPYNLNRLADLAEQLREHLVITYPLIQSA
jgi:hypothetical protein